MTVFYERLWVSRHDKGNILIYQNEKGDTRIDVYFQDSVIWMTQNALAKLYQTTTQNITMHIRSIYQDGELEAASTCKDLLQVQTKQTGRFLCSAYAAMLYPYQSD